MREFETLESCNALLGIEAYQLSEFDQPFPAHVHDHYVIGLVEAGERQVVCRSGEYTLEPGDVFLLNPGDSHACTHASHEPLEYRGINVSRHTMKELCGHEVHFPCAVVREPAIAEAARCAHRALLDQSACQEEREDAALLLVSLLPDDATGEVPSSPDPAGDATDSAAGSPTDSPAARACRYLRVHYPERVSLKALCDHLGVSKSTLLRAFAREQGITPYRYLESVRIEQARRLLRQGVPPALVASACGFTDQSHLTNLFRRLTGLTPGAFQQMQAANVQ